MPRFLRFASRRFWRVAALVAAGCFVCTSQPLLAADLDETRELLAAGKYEEVASAAVQGLAGPDREKDDWCLLGVEALVTLGKHKEARALLEQGLQVSTMSVRLRLEGHLLAKGSGDAAQAELWMRELDQLAGMRTWAYRRPPDQVAIGRAALILGADPKRVLERFLEPVKKTNPEFLPVYLASADLALEKSDFALAAKFIGEARKHAPDHPEVLYRLALSLESSDTKEMLSALEKTLKANPRHTGAQVLLANHFIDAEQYEDADTAIAEALKVNASHSEAHALRAVLAELRAKPALYEEARAAALASWESNPEVDYWIGRKFSQKYRFKEGSERQRRALEFAPSFLRAKLQLAQDLLRLGEDEEGWKLAEEVQKADPYEVTAYNLVTLRESISKFATIETENFLLRMSPEEKAIYGRQAIELLERAHALLCKKYGLEPKAKTIVEIFPDQKDFAIRTFGMPGGAGYLGVCFGRLITMNSPATRPGNPSNWESVLWHEFAHVVTLQLTRNRMPRWLSEGISVYEERQARGNWGERMKPRYRAMILGEDFTPLSELSGAFLQPKTPAHIQFAYYQSSLAVEYLLERFGLDAMKRVLVELGKGVEINAALAKHTAPIAQIDQEFAERTRALALNTGKNLDWAKPAPEEMKSEEALDQWVAANPKNYSALLERARKHLGAREWEQAKEPLRTLIEHYPDQRDGGSAYSLLARVHKELGETEEELTMLRKVAELNSDAPEAYTRLMELCADRKEWDSVVNYAALYEGVDPLTAAPYRLAAQAYEALNQPKKAIERYDTLLKLLPGNPADVRYRLARLLLATGDREKARRNVLQALEEAPRFRDALTLLQQVHANQAAR